jgi:hypothetical protein
VDIQLHIQQENLYVFELSAVAKHLVRLPAKQRWRFDIPSLSMISEAKMYKWRLNVCFGHWDKSCRLMVKQETFHQKPVSQLTFLTGKTAKPSFILFNSFLLHSVPQFVNIVNNVD